ncbi:hypothetical protein PAXINDRAFT_180696 [Paxillus involutus ATCC 200175]|uniref:Uncharacterized protein n=1 Tax=Paxillus involutus ATCC 200175 TaxID=664439 RepID=A0A0C9TI31_PAXIN|nr:hypothetical protein PAXINDRAFT_180696 [Paxillus involutus ATCC 200175]
MSKAQLDIYLRELFPNVSEEVGDSAEAGYPWVLLVKSKNSLTVSSKTTFTGEDILATRTPASRPRDVQSVYIGTVIEIPKIVWQHWNPTANSSGTEMNSEDSEDNSQFYEQGSQGRQPITCSMAKGKGLKQERSLSPINVHASESEPEIITAKGKAKAKQAKVSKGSAIIKKRKVTFGEKQLSMLSLDDNAHDEVLENIRTVVTRRSQRVYRMTTGPSVLDRIPEKAATKEPKSSDGGAELTTNQSFRVKTENVKPTYVNNWQSFDHTDNFNSLSWNEEQIGGPNDLPTTSVEDDTNDTMDSPLTSTSTSFGAFSSAGQSTTGGSASGSVLGGSNRDGSGNSGSRSEHSWHGKYGLPSHFGFEELAKPKANPWAR